MKLDLKKGVLDKIAAIGVPEAAKFFGVSEAVVQNWKAERVNPTLAAAQRLMDLSEEIIHQDEDDEDFVPLTSTPSLTQEEWTLKGKNCMLLWPVYRAYNPDTAFSLMASYAKYGPEKVGIILEKSTVIHEARNILFDKFMKTDAEWALMGPDDDMVIPFGNEAAFNGNYRAGVPAEMAKMNAITRLMSHPADKKIVGVLYWGRHDLGRPQNSLGFNRGWEQQAEKFRKREYQGLVPVDWCGTGFIRIHRSVGDAFQKAISEGQFPECKPVMEGYWNGPFTPIGAGIGEDVSFGIRAAKLGIQSYVDASLECLHTGARHYGAANTRNS